MSTRHSAVQKADDYIVNHWHKSPDLIMVAKAANMSPFHLHRMYREQTGVTIKQRMTDLQMQRAKELLATTTLTLDKISDKVGFKHPTHFASRFRQMMNCTPAKYRAKMRGTVVAKG